jgi:hypothetical protein
VGETPFSHSVSTDGAAEVTIPLWVFTGDVESISDKLGRIRKPSVVRLTETKNCSAPSVHLNADAVAASSLCAFLARSPQTRCFQERETLIALTRGPGSIRAWDEASIQEYVWHCDRHTFCSWLAMAEATIKEIQELAGHKTISMSARYAHMSPDHKVSVIDESQEPATNRHSATRTEAKGANSR